MRKKECGCKEGKRSGFYLEFKVDWTKIVKYVCMTGAFLITLACAFDLFKDCDCDK